MNSVQESKNELEAAIRYAENAISSAQGTIESMEFRQEMAKKNYQEQTGREQALEAQVEQLKAELDKLRKEKESSSGPCGCQAYRDLEERATMPVIPRDVAIAIFREGVQSGINDAVAELEGQSINISENDYVGDFSISFERDIDLDDHLDLDWMRDKVGQYNEEFVVDALKGLCASKEFECRIHGIDDQETNK
jgi:hypothetical protein